MGVPLCLYNLFFQPVSLMTFLCVPAATITQQVQPSQISKKISLLSDSGEVVEGGEAGGPENSGTSPLYTQQTFKVIILEFLLLVLGGDNVYTREK